MVTKTIAAEIPDQSQDRLNAVEMCDDPIEYAIRCTLALAPAVTLAMQASIELAVKVQAGTMLGGDKHYIRQGDSYLIEARTKARNAAILRDYHAGEHVPLLMRRYGLSKARIHQILKF